MKRLSSCLAVFVSATVGLAQLQVTVSPPKIVGQKAVVPLALNNGFAENIESARAVIFLLDNQGKVVGQATRWIIGPASALATDKSETHSGLPPGGTNVYHFVITANKPFVTTNLNTKLSFNRVVLEGGMLANPANEVQIQQAPK